MEKMKSLTLQGTTFEVVDEQARNDVETLANTPADWYQSDSTQPDYIKNRTHYEEWTVAEKSYIELNCSVGETYKFNPYVPPKNKIDEGAIFYFFIDDVLVSAEPFINYSIVEDIFVNLIHSNNLGTDITTRAAKSDRNTKWLVLDIRYTAQKDFTFKCGYAYPTALKTLDEKFIPDNIPKIQSATIGQTIITTEVDENGKPTKWEAADSSWNNLKDKPFYEETEVINGPLNITWDGNTEGLLCVEDEDNYITWCKVSDIILTDEQIKLITETPSDGDSDKISDAWEEMIQYEGVTDDIVGSYWATYVRKSGATMFGLLFPETGIYFFKDNYTYTTSITTTESIECVKSTIYKIDEKFLPIHTWDNLKNKPFGEPMLELGTIVGEFTGECVEANNYNGSKIIYTIRNENVPAFPSECQEANANITVIYDGVEYKTTYWIENFGGMLYGIGNKGLYFYHAEDTGEPFAWYYYGGSYAVSSKEPGEHTLIVRVGDTIGFTKLDKKYLPDIIFTGVPNGDGWYDYTCNVDYETARNALIDGATARMILVDGNEIIHLTLQSVQYNNWRVKLNFFDIRDTNAEYGIIDYNRDGSIGGGVE